MISRLYSNNFKLLSSFRCILNMLLLVLSTYTLIYFICSSNQLILTKPFIFSADKNTTLESSTQFISVSNISDLRKSKFKVGQSVKTLGYYTPYDGGCNEYIIKQGDFVDNGGTIIQISNDNFAVSTNNDSASFQQFGATGNGSSDDFNSLNNALNSGITKFYAGSGTYNLYNKTIKLPRYITIYGDKDNRATIKDGCFTSPYGVSLANLSFVGGAYNKVIVSGHSIFEGRFQSIVIPNGITSISYDNCVFSNTDYCSFAMVGPNQTNLRFSSDSVTNCTFTNVSHIAVYHCLNSDKTSYMYNTFSNIGSPSITAGTIGALKLGDTTNISTLGVSDAYIYMNTFDNLVSGDDYSGAKHVIDCNFITVYGRKAVIEKNTISNLIGYGNDREAVYTKVRYCSVIGNTITNGGLGEGFICNKGYPAADSYAYITNNKIYGTTGTPIQNYGAADISGNEIKLSNAYCAITCHGHSYLDYNRLMINDNIIDCNVDLMPNTSTAKTNIIQLEYPSSEVHIKGNQITCTTKTGRKIESIVKIGGVTKNIYIQNNNITSSIPKCTGILITSSETYEENNTKLWCDISYNSISVIGQPLSIAMRGGQFSSSRQFNIKNNSFIDSSTSKGYATTIASTSSNNDIVYYSKNTTNLPRDLYTTTQRTSVDKNIKFINGYNK